MNKRIKKLRKTLELTQQEFANRIGMKRNTVANYEIDRNEPSNSVITLICREFNVNETWLRTGEGEMFRKQSRSSELAAFVDSLMQSEPDDIRRRFVTAISRLDTKELEILERTALHLADELNADTTATAAEPDDEEEYNPDIEAQVARYRKQLELEASVQTSGASTPAKTG